MASCQLQLEESTAGMSKISNGLGADLRPQSYRMAITPHGDIALHKPPVDVIKKSEESCYRKAKFRINYVNCRSVKLHWKWSHFNRGISVVGGRKLATLCLWRLGTARLNRMKVQNPPACVPLVHCILLFFCNHYGSGYEFLVEERAWKA